MQESFLGRLIGDGRPLLFAVAGSLCFAGGFATFLAGTGDFLPHDVNHLGMTAQELCTVADCRIVDFMVHDRAAFGAALVGMGCLYAWLVAFPLTDGRGWAWWVLAGSAVLGFASFLAYVGSGYLDTWHGLGTLLLAPVFVGGLWRTRARRGAMASLRTVPGWIRRRDRHFLGRAVLLAASVGVAGAAATILRVGVGDTFVPEDLEFIGLTADEVDAVNPRLISLLVHDRIGFGGTLLTLGATTAACLWFSDLAKHLTQAVAVAAGVSLTIAIGAHLAVGYTDPWHLAPPVVALLALVVGVVLSRGVTAAADGRVSAPAD